MVTVVTERWIVYSSCFPQVLPLLVLYVCVQRMCLTCAYSHIIHVFVYIEDCMQMCVCPVLVLMEWRLCIYECYIADMYVVTLCLHA